MLERAVLFVDDEPNILRTLRRLCRREDFAVHTAGSGEEGLAFLREHAVPVVVSDQRMPGLSGVEFLARVKDLQADSIRVILSGYADARTIVEAINKGEIYRFLPKPWDDRELVTTLKQSLDHFFLRRENEILNARLHEQNAELKRLNERLEEAVSIRTQSLAYAQEMLERLPHAVLGLSNEGEIMLTNGKARSAHPCLASVPPGTEVEAVFAPADAAFIRECLESNRAATTHCTIHGRKFAANLAPLGAGGASRGCVIVLLDRR